MSGFTGTQSWEQLDFSARFALQAPPAVVARGMLGMLRYDAEQTLKTIPVPALIVCGDRDTSCVPAASERMARDIPESELITLSPANHMGLVEHHPEFSGAVRRFLSACFKTPAGARTARRPAKQEKGNRRR
jgi:pimeloyl-ACP methyl ester carboxylesterase